MVELDHSTLLRAVALLISAVLVAVEFAASSEDNGEIRHPWGAFFASSALVLFISSAILIIIALSGFFPPSEELPSIVNELQNVLNFLPEYDSNIPSYNGIILSFLFLGFCFLIVVALGIVRETFLNMTNNESISGFLSSKTGGLIQDLSNRMRNLWKRYSSDPEQIPSYVIVGQISEETRVAITKEDTNSIDPGSKPLSDIFDPADDGNTSFYLTCGEYDYICFSHNISNSIGETKTLEICDNITEDKYKETSDETAE